MDLGQKLQGVSNMVGHQMAVDEMADMLGIHIPQVGVMYIVKLLFTYSQLRIPYGCFTDARPSFFSVPSSMPMLQV